MLFSNHKEMVSLLITKKTKTKKGVHWPFIFIISNKNNQISFSQSYYLRNISKSNYNIASLYSGDNFE